MFTYIHIEILICYINKYLLLFCNSVKYKISSSSSTQMNEKEQGTKRVLFYLD